MEALEQPFLRIAIEVDQNVAAANHVERARWLGIGEQIAPLEANEPTNPGGDGKWRHRREIPFSQLARRFGEVGFLEFAALSRVEARPIDVRAEDVDAADLREHARRRRKAVEEDRQRVRLLAGRASRAPYADLRAIGVPESGHDVRGDCRVDFPVSKELGDVDGQRIEQAIVLRRVAVENTSVVAVRVHAARAHADGDSAPNTLFLVACAAEPAVGGDLPRELDEAFWRTIDHQ